MRWHERIQALFSHLENGPELVLFDLDGTLINSVPDLAAAVDTMLQESGKPIAGQQNVSHWVGNGADKLVRRALCNGDDVAADALDPESVAPYRAIFDRAYLSALHHATGVYPGVQSLLDRLSEAGIPKVLITNKPRLFTEPLVESLGWQGQFQLLLCGDDLAEKKPSPMPLLFACDRLAVSPGKALMVGDSRHDIGAAKAAGIVSVGVPYGYNHGDDIALSGPDMVVDNLKNLIFAG